MIRIELRFAQTPPAHGWCRKKRQYQAVAVFVQQKNFIGRVQASCFSSQQIVNIWWGLCQSLMSAHKKIRVGSCVSPDLRLSRNVGISPTCLIWRTMGTLLRIWHAWYLFSPIVNSVVTVYNADIALLDRICVRWSIENCWSRVSLLACQLDCRVVTWSYLWRNTVRACFLFDLEFHMRTIGLPCCEAELPVEQYCAGLFLLWSLLSGHWISVLSCEPTTDVMRATPSYRTSRVMTCVVPCRRPPKTRKTDSQPHHRSCQAPSLAR